MPTTAIMYNRPPSMEASAPVRHVLVETAVAAGVLRLVDVAGLVIDHHRFVREAAHVDDRPRVAVLGADLEAPSVSDVGGFLTGDPRAPGRHAAGAVANGAGQCRPRLDPSSAFGVEDDIGGAARTVLAIGNRRPVQVRRSDRFLMVANDNQPPGSPSAVVIVIILPPVVVPAAVAVVVVVVAPVQFVDDGHPVVQTGARHPVGHHVAGPAEGAVFETLGQL